MWMRREVQIGATMVMEKIRLATFWRSKTPMESFIHAALQARIARELNKIAIYIPSPYANEWEKMFLKFFPDADAAKRFAAGIPSGDFSPATIQERLLKSKSIEQAFLAFLPDPSAQ